MNLSRHAVAEPYLSAAMSPVLEDESVQCLLTFSLILFYFLLILLSSANYFGSFLLNYSELYKRNHLQNKPRLPKQYLVFYLYTH